ncbi:MAG: hypothetical protein AAGC91_08975 [Pseudomonadota bacterium]
MSVATIVPSRALALALAVFLLLIAAAQSSAQTKTTLPHPNIAATDATQIKIPVHVSEQKLQALAESTIAVDRSPASKLGRKQAVTSQSAKLSRIRMVTVSSEDPAASAAIYRRWLDYVHVESGVIDRSLARAWRAPKVAGRPYELLKSPTEQAFYLRFVQTQIPPDYAPVSSTGWNALELLVNDPYTLAEHLKPSPLRQLGEPRAIAEGSSIHATQYLGPDDEVIYFTAETSPDEDSTLDVTDARVGRAFVVVVAAGEIAPLQRFYQDVFGLSTAYELSLPIPFLARLQGSPDTHEFPLAILRLSAFSHAVELDAYPRPNARHRIPGELPPGIAMVSFCMGKNAQGFDAMAQNPGWTVQPVLSEDANDLAAGSPEDAGANALVDGPILSSDFILRPASMAYGKGRAVTVTGAAGELIELIECVSS